MVAMRLYSRKDFESKLKEVYKLSPTDETVDDTRLWKTENDCYIAITELPEGHGYPDYCRTFEFTRIALSLKNEN